jgi:hypothetical protein
MIEILRAIFVPELLYILIWSEAEKGSPLTEEEVLQLRDKAVSIMLPVDEAEKIEKARGYQDLDPEYCWEDWCAYKAQFSEENPS